MQEAVDAMHAETAAIQASITALGSETAVAQTELTALKRNDSAKDAVVQAQRDYDAVRTLLPLKVSALSPNQMVVDFGNVFSTTDLEWSWLVRFTAGMAKTEGQRELRVTETTLELADCLTWNPLWTLLTVPSVTWSDAMPDLVRDLSAELLAVQRVHNQLECVKLLQKVTFETDDSGVKVLINFSWWVSTTCISVCTSVLLAESRASLVSSHSIV
jgi:hypothetical protein